MKTTRVVITDDFDGSEEGVETVRFSLAGADYDIDLSAEHARELEAALEPFVSAGHRVGGKARRATAPAVSGGPDPKVVRAWAIEQGIDVSARGRVAKDVIDRYLLAA